MMTVQFRTQRKEMIQILEREKQITSTRERSIPPKNRKEIMKKEKIEKRAIQHEKEMKKIKSGTEESEAEKERGNQEVEIAAGSFNNHRKEVSRQKATFWHSAKLIHLFFTGITTREEEA